MHARTLTEQLAVLGRGLWRLPRMVLVGVVKVYQLVLSPLFPPTCRYTPTCSSYAVLALKQYGAVRGSILAVWRILRCAPWGGHGYDPPRWFTEVDHRSGKSTSSLGNSHPDGCEHSHE